MKVRFYFFLIYISLLPMACKDPGTESTSTSFTIQATSTLVASTNLTPTEIEATSTSAQPLPTITPLPTSTQPLFQIPDPTPTWWSSLPAAPNQQQIAPTPLPMPSFPRTSSPVGEDGVVIFDEARKEAWETALGPLPEWKLSLFSFTDSGPTEWVTVTAEFKPTRLVEINFDEDDARELVLVYLLIPPDLGDGSEVTYENGSGGWRSPLARGEYGFAVFDDDDSLLWRSDLTGLFDYTEFELAKVNLSEDMDSLLLSRKWVGGHHHNVTYYLYSWQGFELKEYWSETVDSFAWSGSAFNTSVTKQISFQDVDNDGITEILSAYSTKRVHSAGPCCFINYNLHFPGALVYKRQSNNFSLRYLLIDGVLHNIHPQAPVTIVPYVENPIVVDGNFTDWYQVEYAIPLYDRGLNYQNCEVNSFPHFIWDDENFYVKLRLKQGDQVTLALDSNLTADFGKAESDEDDRFLTASIEGQGMLNLSFQSETNGDTSEIVSAVGPMVGEGELFYPGTFPVEISIPLDLLGLADLTITNPIGWGQEEGGERFYYPTMQAIVGYVTQTNQSSVRPTCAELNGDIVAGSAVLDLNNPTTWGTLVFTADR